jgi:hypothetical protein
MSYAGPIVIRNTESPQMVFRAIGHIQWVSIRRRSEFDVVLIASFFSAQVVYVRHVRHMSSARLMTSTAVEMEGNGCFFE